MKLKFFFTFLVGLTLISESARLEAAYTIKGGRVINVALIARHSAQEHFDMGCTAVNAEDWAEAIQQFHIVLTNYPNTTYGQEANYYAGLCCYYLKEYDCANELFTQYLKVQNQPRYFQETIEFKYDIAERFSGGSKRRFFGTKKLPKWACGKDMALKIYDEVIAAVPSHDMAARALVSKGCLLWRLRDFRHCVEAFQLAIRRFPRHELTPECYVYISRVFIAQSRIEFQNPDILAFAEINYRRFTQDFPREERLNEAAENVQAIKEIYARGLFDTGRFYERTCKGTAAILYYRKAVHQFPDTCIANVCRDRLEVLDPNFEEFSCEPLSPELPLDGEQSDNDAFFDLEL